MSQANLFRTNVMWCGGSLVLVAIYMSFTIGDILDMFPSLVASLFSVIFFVLGLIYTALGIVLLGLQVQLRPTERLSKELQLNSRMH